MRTPIHRVLGMYRELTGKAGVPTVTRCPAVDTPALLNLPARKAVPVLDVSATRDEDRLTVFVINRDPGKPQEARIDVSGFQCSGRARVHGVAADGYSAENTVDEPGAVVERASEVEWKGHLRFPPCSVTAVVLGS